MKNNTLKGVSAVVIVGIIVALVVLLPKNPNSADTNTIAVNTVDSAPATNTGIDAVPVQTTPTPVTPTPVVPTPVTPTPVPTNPQTSMYKDGTYTADGTYESPEGGERIKISLTIKNDVVTDTSAINEAHDRQSIFYQNMFIQNYKQYVVGKSISQLTLGKVSGSSLTPRGFNNAVTIIKNQAKV